VVALEAFTAYSLKMANITSELNVNITENETTHSFQVNDDNVLLAQKMKLKSLPTSLEIEVTGKGCLLLQTILR